MGAFAFLFAGSVGFEPTYYELTARPIAIMVRPNLEAMAGIEPTLVALQATAFAPWLHGYYNTSG